MDRSPLRNRLSFSHIPLRPVSLCGISHCFQWLSRCLGQVSYVLRTRSPLSTQPKSSFPFDLHVLGTPPAFILSQDQTLRIHFRAFLLPTILLLNCVSPSLPTFSLPVNNLCNPVWVIWDISSPVFQSSYFCKLFALAFSSSGRVSYHTPPTCQGLCSKSHKFPQTPLSNRNFYLSLTACQLSVSSQFFGFLPTIFDTEYSL